MEPTVDAITTQDIIFNTEIKNKGFALLDIMFKNHGWKLIKNEMNFISYTKSGKETETFDIEIEKKCIFVSVPLKKSTYRYSTSFTEYFSASEYVEARFYDFME